MSWKKAFFFGGAVLLLAACGDATAPSALNKLDRTSASAKQVSKPKPPIKSDSTAVPIVPTNCANAIIHWGEDGSMIVTCESSGTQ